MKRKLWTLLLALGAALALCVGASATEQDDFSEAFNISGSITLDSNVTYSGLLKVYKDFTIDLNGYVLDIPDGIYAAQGARLTIRDSSTELSEESRPTHTNSAHPTPTAAGCWTKAPVEQRARIIRPSPGASSSAERESRTPTIQHSAEAACMWRPAVH